MLRLIGLAAYGFLFGYNLSLFTRLHHIGNLIICLISGLIALLILLKWPDQ